MGHKTDKTENQLNIIDFSLLSQIITYARIVEGTPFSPLVASPAHFRTLPYFVMSSTFKRVSTPMA